MRLLNQLREHSMNPIFCAMISAVLCCGAVRAQDSLNVAKMGEIGVGGSSYSDVVVSGNIAYVLDNNALRILDITDPVAPSELGFCPILKDAYNANLAVSGAYVYVPCGSYGMRVIDVSNPGLPIEVGVYNTAGRSQGIDISGNYAFIADGYAGLRVVDVSNPTSPVGVGIYNTPYDAVGIVVVGSYAYIDDSYTLRIFNISNPAIPIEIGYCSTFSHGNTWDLCVSDDYAFIAAGAGGWGIFDISDPASPWGIGFFDIPGNTVIDVAILDNYAYVCNLIIGEGAALQVINVSNPSLPIEVNACLIGPNFYFQGMAISDNHAFLASGSDGLQIVDIANPILPVKIACFNSSYSLRDIFVLGDYAYALDSYTFLRIFDISNPNNPAEFSSYNLRSATSIAVIENYAYVSDDYFGLRIVDITNPIAPTEIGVCSTPGQANKTILSDSYAYVADNEYGLRVIDVSNPVNPIEVGFYDTPGDARDVAIQGNYAYMAEADPFTGLNRNLRVIDITNPAVPIPVGLCNIGDDASCVAVSDNIAILSSASGFAYLYLVDITNSTNPVLLGYYYDASGQWISSVVILDNIAYCSAYSAHDLSMLDISNPANPLEVGYYGNNSWTSYSLSVNGCHAYVSGRSSFSIYDISYFEPCPVPRAPDSLVIAYTDNNIELNWSPVTLDTSGAAIDVDYYFVYRSDSTESVNWDLIGVPYPPDTTVFVDTTATTLQRFYQVRAVMD